MGVADALGHLAGDEKVERLVGEHADLAVDERGIDEAAATGALALGERGEDADRGIDAGENIGDRHPRALRLAVGRSRQLHDAAHALGHEVVARARGVGPGLAEAGDGAVDQARVVLGQALVVEAEFGEPADLEILDQHVGASRELADDAASILALEIQLDRALAAVGGVEIGSPEMAAVGRLHKGGAPAAGVVARALALDLDDVGAEIGENLPCPGPRQDAGKLEHTYSGQRPRH